MKVGGVPATDIIPTTDARVATSQALTVSLSNQLRTVTLTKEITGESLAWVCRGYISKAFERGYGGFASSQYSPYYALVYMTNLLINYASDQTIPVTQLPYWLLCLGHAISPKSVPFGHGLASYKMKVTDTVPYIPSVNAAIGYQTYGYLWTAGWTSGSTINGFPVISTAGAAYTDALGASAFQELCQFMATNTSKTSMARVNQLVPSTISTPFKTDVSSYAIFSQAEGLGATGFGGGLYGQLQLEVPIRHPILSLVSCGSDSQFVRLPTRNFNWATPIAGDPCSLGAIMSSVLSTPELSMKRNIRFKSVDFLEFLDVVAQWVSQIVQAYFNDKDNLITATSAATAVCPLTLQEVGLLLRNTIMSAFKQSQAAAQGVYPFSPTAGTDNEFVPFVNSITTCPLNMLDMQLPRPLIENIRALAARHLKYPASSHDILWYFPVLGQYCLDVLSSSSYVATWNDAGVPTTVNVFTSGAIFAKLETDSKGNEVRIPMVESEISFIDGSSGTSLVFINDPEQLKIKAAMWNQWIKTSGLESYSTSLGTVGTENGINVLCSISTTRIWADLATDISRDGRADRRLERARSMSKSSSVVIDTRMEQPRYRPLVSTPYASRKAIIDVSQGEILSAPYEQVLATWILPIDDDEVVVNTSNSLVVQRWQFIMEEPHSQARTSSDSGVPLSDLHSVYASKMVKGKLAEKADWSQFFDEMEKLGRGGILTGLVAGLVGKAVPALSDVAQQISNALPF